jgi:uncharacterized membrane protein YciS (DUF1049 family)
VTLCAENGGRRARAQLIAGEDKTIQFGYALIRKHYTMASIMAPAHFAEAATNIYRSRLMYLRLHFARCRTRAKVVAISRASKRF